jgi:hypothetical protein
MMTSGKGIFMLRSSSHVGATASQALDLDNTATAHRGCDCSRVSTALAWSGYIQKLEDDMSIGIFRVLVM